MSSSRSYAWQAARNTTGEASESHDGDQHGNAEEAFQVNESYFLALTEYYTKYDKLPVTIV